MIKVHFLGTCSGTEPMPGMHHCSLIFEVDGYNYWFDAGECCVHSAHTGGINIMNTRALFVSHPHLDHTGGLANLLAAIRKLAWREKRNLIHENTLDLYFPGLDVFGAVKTLISSKVTDNPKYLFNLIEHELDTDGLLFEDERVRVSAVHNRHMKEDGTNGWHSYSFLIEAEGKRFVFSGDVAEPCELDPIIENCDFLIMETGHHPVKDVCEYAISRGVKALRFNHHGREILGDRAAAEKLVSDYAASANISIKIAHDGMCELL